MAKMPARTLEALKGSIAKWEAIVAGTGKDHGTSNCPLCAEFFDDYCVGCPVRKKTGFSVCRQTPYKDWSSAIRAKFSPFEPATASTSELVALAQAELDFLRSLLPEGE